MKINAAWSGGYDSTYMIIKFLEQGYTVKPYYFIHKQRIDISIEAVNLEINAVKNISKILKKQYKNNLENVEFINFSNMEGDQYKIIGDYMKSIDETIAIGVFNEDINENVFRVLSHITDNVPEWTTTFFLEILCSGNENIPTSKLYLDVKTINCRVNADYCESHIQYRYEEWFNGVFRLPTIYKVKHLSLLEMYENYNDIFSLCICCRNTINGQPCDKDSCKFCRKWDQYKLEKSLTLERARKLRNYLTENNISPDIIHEIPINKSLKLPKHITEPLDSYIDGRGNVKELRKKLNLK